ncbi:glucose dehydrogenase [FAD, quinone]-like [Ctenocephalides felis]|uniref:glucose dehydrogenase [FAD, quinone]-like n=1 Tax=Ctenocephalides felis TaxID=7515 RepID=UPI000E6E1A98|nr:glucose dehydrogenase [FAD, quinone]-like [Ctenocephalides felis]
MSPYNTYFIKKNIVIIVFIWVHITVILVSSNSKEPFDNLKENLYKNLGHQDADNAVSYLTKYFQLTSGQYNIPLVESFEDVYDFIIIGSGPGGSVMANRLSEVLDWNILILEAGEQESPLTDIPLLPNILPESKYDWNYKTVSQTRCCSDQKGYCKQPRGKALGGTSVINYMVYVRGNKYDFNTWQHLGNTGWGYYNILKYFKKSEDMQIKHLQNSPFHSTSGYLTVDLNKYQTHLDDLLIQAGRELGYWNNDNNGANQTGILHQQSMIRDGRRCSASKAFLKPVVDRTNLSIATGAFVTKILIDPDNKRAYGVTFTKNGKEHTTRVRKEVILSAGAINSAQLLMLSGVGPANHLQDLGIEVIQDLPVGKELKNHFGSPDLQFDIDGNFEVDIGVLGSSKHVTDYFEKGIGPLTIPDGMIAIASVKTSRYNIDLPDVEINFRAANLYKDIDKNKTRDSFYAFVLLLRPKSVGRLLLNSRDPTDSPKIDVNCFAENEDVETLVKGIKVAVEMSRTKVLSKYNVTLKLEPDEECDKFGKETDAYWRCFLKNSTSGNHQIRTCKMGPADDPTSVVDPSTLKPYGIQGLRVVDASVIPEPPTGHTTAVVYMVAEKAADFVKAEWT